MNPLGPDQRFYVSHTEDDSEAYRLVEEVRRRGMKLWLRFEGHHHGEAGRPIIAETFEGVKFLDLPRVRYSLESQKAICFSKPIVKEYGPQVYAYGAKTYEPDSMITNHFRYTNPSYWPNPVSYTHLTLPTN